MISSAYLGSIQKSVDVGGVVYACYEMCCGMLGICTAFSAFTKYNIYNMGLRQSTCGTPTFVEKELLYLS